MKIFFEYVFYRMAKLHPYKEYHEGTLSLTVCQTLIIVNIIFFLIYGRASLPNVPTGKTDADVEASIHSHPTKAEVIGEKVYSGDATVPGPNDPATFVRFGTNIIVGPLGKASGSYQTNSVTGQQSIVPSAKPNGVVIYNNSYAQPLQLSQKAVEKIIK